MTQYLLAVHMVDGEPDGPMGDHRATDHPYGWNGAPRSPQPGTGV